MKTKTLFIGLFLVAGCGPNAQDAMCTATIAASGDATANHNAIQTALSNAKPGNVVCLHAGTYPLNDELSLATDNVEIRSMTDGTAVLDYTTQTHGANGLSTVGVNGVKLTGFTVKNTPGDAIRINQATGVTLTGLTVTWDGGPLTTNGAYGLYPVQSSHVLIDNCKVSYAADAGIYVGQSNTILVRNSEAFGNVAGIEIENSTDAEVVNNYAHDNTGGILVFNLPNLMMQGAGRVNVHGNKVQHNNGMNFAAKSSIVSIVPTGTGVLVNAMANNEFHDNEIDDNDSVGVAVVSYYIAMMPYTDPAYNPYPTGNYVHDNHFSNNGMSPDGVAGNIALVLNVKTVEDMIWDGLVDKTKPNADGSLTNCFHNNGTATFRTLGIPDPMNLTDFSKTSTDVKPFDCMHPALPTITP